jgi:hypothetical protein
MQSKRLFSVELRISMLAIAYGVPPARLESMSFREFAQAKIAHDAKLGMRTVRS